MLVIFAMEKMIARQSLNVFQAERSATIGKHARRQFGSRTTWIHQIATKAIGATPLVTVRTFDNTILLLVEV